VSDCLLYGQYGTGIIDFNGPNDLRVQNVDIRHTYHCHQLGDKNNVTMLTWAINMQNVVGGGGKRTIERCSIDQSPTWQEYYFAGNPKQGRYFIGSIPGSHGITMWGQEKASPDDYVRIADCTIINCGSNCVVFDTSNVNLTITNCAIDGGYFAIPVSKTSRLPDWRGNCIIVDLPSVDAWGQPPVVQIEQNELTARGWDGWGVKLDGCPNGEVTVADNLIICQAAQPGYAGGVKLQPYWTEGSNGNAILRNTIRGTGSWAISVNAPSLIPCVGNSFIDNNLSDFAAPQPEVVFFGPVAQDNTLSGSGDVGVLDLGTGNVVE
jgi:hypothetical protein